MVDERLRRAAHGAGRLRDATAQESTAECQAVSAAEQHTEQRGTSTVLLLPCELWQALLEGAVGGRCSHLTAPSGCES